MDICRSLIGGQPVGSSQPPIDKFYPATGEVIARIEPADESMLDQAVTIAADAQVEWAARSGTDRSSILNRAAQLLRDRNEELSRLEVRDVGKCYGEAVSADVPSGADAMAYFAALAATETGDMHRYPDAIAFILKPSEMTPLTSHLVADILQEAGLPDGLFQILHGDYRIGRAICEHPGIAKISLTGGVDTGRLIMAQSATTLKKVTLELGGKSPLLVFADADFDLAVQTALDANFYTAGEVCSNATRVFVEASIANEFEAALVERARELRVGDPMSEDVQLGALISEPHLNKVLDYVSLGQKEGARLATGGKRVHPQGFETGYFMEPTILADCHDDMRVVQEEIFGPVMSVLTFETEDEAVERANGTQFGLGAGLITRDLGRAHHVANKLVSGNVWVTSYTLLPPGLPFGGARQSGFGRENSAYSLEAYSEVKTTYIQL